MTYTSLDYANHGNKLVRNTLYYDTRIRDIEVGEVRQNIGYMKMDLGKELDGLGGSAQRIIIQSM